MKISKLKKLYSFCSAVLAAVLFSMPVFAADQKDTSGEIHQSQVIMTNKYGTEVEIDFANSDTGATYNIVQSIIDSNPQATKFTIYEAGDAEAGLETYPNKLEASTGEWNPPFGSTYKYQTEKMPVGSEKVVKDDFVISVARGQTITLSRKYTGTLSSGGTYQEATRYASYSIDKNY